MNSRRLADERCDFQFQLTRIYSLFLTRIILRLFLGKVLCTFPSYSWRICEWHSIRISRLLENDLLFHSEKVWFFLSRRFFNSIREVNSLTFEKEFSSSYYLWPSSEKFQYSFRTLVLILRRTLVSISRKCFDFIRARTNVHFGRIF